MQRDYTINKKLERFLRENDKKTGAVADRAGIRRDVFSKILHCRRPIYADELIPILNAAGMSLESVITIISQSEEVRQCRD